MSWGHGNSVVAESWIDTPRAMCKFVLDVVGKEVKNFQLGLQSILPV